MLPEERRNRLCCQKRWTGIDFVQVVEPDDQTRLRVFFIHDPDKLEDGDDQNMGIVDPDHIAPPPELNDEVPEVPYPFEELPSGDKQETHYIEGSFYVHPNYLPGSLDRIEIRAVGGGERLARVPVNYAYFVRMELDGIERIALEIRVAEPGDFANYQLCIIDSAPIDGHMQQPWIDRFFNCVTFSFKQGCETGFDCETELLCPDEDVVDVSVDYLARDFHSYNRALLDFAAQRYPHWRERIPADAAFMLMDIMSALGDEYSYIQDRYSRELHLETATERRSLRRLAHLVDYQIHDGHAATTCMALFGKRAEAGDTPMGHWVHAGQRIWSIPEGEAPIPFELGLGLRYQKSLNPDEREALEPNCWWVHSDWNEMRPFFPDSSQTCLMIGATEMYLRGDCYAELLTETHLPEELRDKFDNVEDFWTGRKMTIIERSNDPSAPRRRHMIHVLKAEVLVDALVPHFKCPYPDEGKEYDEDCGDENGPKLVPPVPYVRITWSEDEALPFDICLLETTVYGNMVPAIAGETVVEYFGIPKRKQAPALPETCESTLQCLDLEEGGIAEPLPMGFTPVVEREGIFNENTGERAVTYYYSLQAAETRGLGWVGERNLEGLQGSDPEIEVIEVGCLDPQDEGEGEEAERDCPEDPNDWVAGRPWDHVNSLMNAPANEPMYTLEDGTWKRLVGYWNNGEEFVHNDYAHGSGYTIRFGDGEFGEEPDAGSTYKVRYRTGPGTRANVPMDSVNLLQPPEGVIVSEDDLEDGVLLDDVLTGATNPFAVTSGQDPETVEQIRELAPEAFKELTLRAVQDADYAKQTERLDWVQQGGATARWTGSWLTEFVAADPKGAFEYQDGQRVELENLLDCVRQVGRGVQVMEPFFVNVDLEICICTTPEAFDGQVKEDVLLALVGREGRVPVKGFFHPDNFTFGTDLRRATLEGTIQDVQGVQGIMFLRMRARGITDWREFKELRFPITRNQIVRCMNNPLYPDRGMIRVITPDEKPKSIPKEHAYAAPEREELAF